MGRSWSNEEIAAEITALIKSWHLLFHFQLSNVVHVEGDPDSPINRGALCSKGITLRQFVVNDRRLTRPLYRAPGSREWKTISWDEALDRTAQGFRRSVEKHGPQAFGMFSCSKATNELNFLAQKFARAVIGSNNIDSCNRT